MPATRPADDEVARRWAEGFVPNPGSTSTADAPQYLPPEDPTAESAAVGEQMSLVFGTSGQKYASGHGDEEYHALLSNRERAVEAYDQLITGNALVAGPLGRIEGQLRQADWRFSAAPRIEPPPSLQRLRDRFELDADDAEREDLEHEAIQFHSSWLLGGPAREYTMETSWKQQMLHEACLFLAHPSSIFEIVLRRAHGPFGTKIVPQRLCWMHPRSVKAFKINEAGRLKGIAQEDTLGWDDREDTSYGGGKTKLHRAFIPASKLLILSRNRKGRLPEGTPFTRHMYADAERASHGIKWQLVDAQNRAVGIPMVEIPKGVHGKVVSSSIAQARRMTYGNQHLAYVVAPEGIKVGYVDMSANTVNLDEIIKAQERRMRHVTGTEFTALGGESGSGAFALAKVLREEFNYVVVGVASAIIEDIQRGLIELVHRLNYGDRVACPRLEADGLLTVDPEALATLVEKKVIPADRDVANVARRAIGLGPLSSDEAEIDTSQLNDLALAKAVVMTGEVVDAVHEKLGLPKLPSELRDKYDAEPVNTQKVKPPGADRLSSAPTSFGAGPPPGPAGPVTKAQRARAAELKALRKEFVETIVERMAELRAGIVHEIAGKATASETGSKLGGRLAPSKSSRLAFRRSLRELADELLEQGRKSMLDDAARYARSKGARVEFASVALEAPGEDGGLPPRIEERLNLVTELNADAILDAIEPMLRKAYWRARSTGETASDALETATREVAESGSQMLKTAAYEISGTAVNSGRTVALGEVLGPLGEADLDIEYVTRVHEGPPTGKGCPCEPCRARDGKRVRIDSDEYDEEEPPRHCEGYERCHCVYVLDDPEG